MTKCVMVPYLAALTLAIACGGPRDIGGELPTADDYEDLGRGFRPPEIRSGDLPVIGGSQKEEGAAGLPAATPGRAGGDDAMSGGLAVGREAACTWSALQTEGGWSGRCELRSHGSVRIPLPVPRVVDMRSVGLYSESGAKFAPKDALKYYPASNELAVPRVSRIVRVILNAGPGDLVPEWVLDDTIHDVQVHCGNASFVHASPTDQRAIAIDAKALAKAVRPKREAKDLVYLFDLSDREASAFARYTVSMRTGAADAPTFDPCGVPPSGRLRVVWDGIVGRVRVVVDAAGVVTRVSLMNTLLQSRSGFLPQVDEGHAFSLMDRAGIEVKINEVVE